MPEDGRVAAGCGVPYSSHPVGQADFATALRKVDRMRVPAAEACLWQRALTDVEYLGIPIPGLPGASAGAPLVESDLDFLSASHAWRERLTAERQCAAADMSRLKDGIAAGWLERAGQRVAEDFVPDGTAEQPDGGIDDDRMRMGVGSLIGSLTPREQLILRLRYGLGGEEEHTLEQIGQSLGLSRERVRQLEARALKKLRETQPAQRLHPILEP